MMLRMVASYSLGHYSPIIHKVSFDRQLHMLTRKYRVGNGVYQPQTIKLQAQSSNNKDSEGFKLSAWLSPYTRGGVLVWSTSLLVIPVVCYRFLVLQGLDELQVGAYVGALFVLITCLLWALSYAVRISNKDMTYAKQLRDYDNGVLQNRLNELIDEEINALMDEKEQ